MSAAISLSIPHPSSKPHPTSENSGARRTILSSSSLTPTEVGHPSPARPLRISEPSSHDDYISRLENLQQRLSRMDSVLQGQGNFHGDRRVIQETLL
uniref:Uncharacterized protein n=1 Tax=Magallana gigas TaxID=29159 RepID=A0A8W8M4Y4_MAGGI